MGQIVPPGGTGCRLWPPSRAASAPTLAIAGVSYYFSPWYTGVGYCPAQPVPYSHKLLVGEPGLDCRDVPTASFHQESILKYPDGQIFDVITNGQGLLAGYSWPIPPPDRRAIVAHVRELERKRLARATGAPAGSH